MAGATRHSVLDNGGDPATTLAAARGSAARRHTGWPRRVLSGHIAALMWMLRLYVVGMLAVVAVQIARLI